MREAYAYSLIVELFSRCLKLIKLTPTFNMEIKRQDTVYVNGCLQIDINVKHSRSLICVFSGLLQNLSTHDYLQGA